MSLRTYLFNSLSTYTPITDLVGGAAGVIPAQSMMTAQTPKPFLVFTLGNDTDENQFDDPDIPQRPHRQFFQVYIHDVRPSYVQIDAIELLVKQCLRLNQISPDDGIIAVKFLEGSADFDDVTLDTVFRYLRFQAIMV